MNSATFQQHLIHLQLTQADAAALLRVTARTIRRWQKDDTVPTDVAQRLQAWRQLSDAKLPWTADMRDFWRADRVDQIQLHTEHDLVLVSVLERVAKRGGPATSWQIDLGKGKATLGPMTVSFYLLQNEGFSLAHYRRSDIDPDVARDSQLIEDAVAAFAEAVSKARTARPGQYWNGKPITDRVAALVPSHRASAQNS